MRKEREKKGEDIVVFVPWVHLEPNQKDLLISLLFDSLKVN